MDKNRLKKYLKEDLSLRKIAKKEEVEINRHKISKLIKEYGIKDLQKTSAPMKYSKEEINLVQSMYVSGVKPKEIYHTLKDLGYNRTQQAIYTLVSGEGWEPKVEDLPNEEWDTHIDFPDYFVSNQGRIKSKLRGRLISVREHFGYLDCRIQNKQGIKKSPRIHRLVAETFIPNTNNKKCVNHINGDKLDNRTINLEWVTYSENNKHAYETGLKKSPDKATKLTVKEVKLICSLLEKGYTVPNIYKIKDWSVTRRCLNQIKNKKNWIDISKNYTW